MMKEEKNLIIIAVAGIAGLLILSLFLVFQGCEDSQGDDEIAALNWECDDCRAQFSEYEHLQTHKCNKLYSEETDLKLRLLAEDIERYGINYPKEPNKVWGNGNPTPEHIEFFGNENLSRLCFVQTQTINKQGQALAELTLRVRKLEDPNGIKERKTPDKP
jgi:hypothetical protein